MRKPNRQAEAQRAVADRYGMVQRSNLYKRLASARPFALFVVEGKLSICDFPSPRSTWLQVDCPAGLVGIYTDMPTWQGLVDDLQHTEQVLRQIAPAA